MNKRNAYWFAGLRLLALFLVLALAFGMDRWMASQVARSLISGSDQGVDQTRFVAGVGLGAALLGLTWFVVLYQKARPFVGWVYLVLGLFLNALPLLSIGSSRVEAVAGGGLLEWLMALSRGDFFAYTSMYIPFVGLFSMIVKKPPEPGGYSG